MSESAPVSRAAALLAAHTGGKTVRPGALLNVPIDRVVLDAPGTHAVATAWRRFSQGKEVAFAERFVCVEGGRLPRKERPRALAFAARHGLTLGLDPQAPGWPSTVAAEEGAIGSDDVVMAERSDVCALGGLGTLVVRGEAPGLAELLGRRTVAIPVPESRVVAVSGRLPRWIEPFDLAHHILEALGGRSGVAGRVLQLQGDTVFALSIEGRMALCRALAQAGAVALVPPDEATRVWLRARRAPEDGAAGARNPRRRASKGDLPSGASAAGDDRGPGAECEQVLNLDARKVRFVALERPFPGTRLRVGGGAEQGSDRGSAPNDEQSPGGAGNGGRSGQGAGSAPGEGEGIEQIIVAGALSELRMVAEAMRERHLARGIHLVVIPASRRVLLHAIEEGLGANLIRAGATLLPPGSEAPPAPRAERRISTVPTGGGEILVSPALAGASAVTGQLIDPESMRRLVRRKASIR